MSKIFRKWIQTSWDQPGALRGLDIPYSDSYSLTARIDQIKDSTDQSIRVEEVTNTPPSQTDVGKIYTKNGDLFFLDESGNEIRISKEGSMASINRTKIEKHTEYKVLDATDVSNMYIDLQKAPSPISSVDFSRLGGRTFMYETDFTVESAPGSNDSKRLTWDSTADLQISDVVKISYICPEEIQIAPLTKRNEYFTLTGTDITNKYVALEYEPNPRNSCETLELSLVSGSQVFEYGVDFIIKQDSNKDYKILSWAATDTTSGLETVLTSGDILKVNYVNIDSTQLQETQKQVQYVTITATNVTNKYVDIAYTPVPIEATEMTILGGVETQYQKDFVIKRDSNGNFRRLSWAAADCTDGLEGVIVDGDIFKVSFMDGVGLIGAIRVSASDTSPAFLSSKIIAGTNISIAITGTGSDQTLTISSASATDKEVEYLTLSSTDISNKYKDLTYSPVNANEAEMTIIGGLDQNYGVDYTVITNGSVVKRVTWDTGVSGGPSSGLIGALVDGDKIKVSYIRTL